MAFFLPPLLPEIETRMKLSPVELNRWDFYMIPTYCGPWTYNPNSDANSDVLRKQWQQHLHGSGRYSWCWCGNIGILASSICLIGNSSQPRSGNEHFILRNLMDSGLLTLGMHAQHFFAHIHSILARPDLHFFAPSDHLPIVYIDYPARF